MKIGVISDTHDNLEKTEIVVDFFEDEEVETVIHCGDVVAPFTAELFDAGFEFHAVKGNNDGEWNLKQVIEDFGNFYNNIAELEFEGQSICVYHGTEEEIVEGLVEKDYDYVFRGHTHRKKIKYHGETVEVNPGGIKLPGQDEKLHVAVVDLGNGKIKHFSLEDIE